MGFPAVSSVPQSAAFRRPWDLPQAERIEHALETTILNKTVTYDLARLMEDATELSCSAFATAIIKNM